jgi:hypothetical protein
VSDWIMMQCSVIKAKQAGCGSAVEEEGRGKRAVPKRALTSSTPSWSISVAISRSLMSNAISYLKERRKHVVSE